MLPEWPQNRIAANGAEFNYYRTVGSAGAGKPVLVLQHGLSDTGLCWAPVARELAGEYDIIMPDARGHGHSARVVAGEDVDQAADLAALLGALGVNKALVAGHSLGAQIAADLAARFPERVTAVVLEDPPWFLPRPTPEPGAGARAAPARPRFSQWFIEQQAKSLEQVMAECRQEHPTWPEAYVRAWCQGKHELDLNFLPQIERPRDWQGCVPAIRCPALLITAEPEKGGLVTPEVERWVKAANPNFRSINFPGVGHHVRFAMHDRYMQVFKAFLQEMA
ncbi:MAG: alpha/beta hydrolase [Anaerolineales bacterium]